MASGLSSKLKGFIVIIICTYHKHCISEVTLKMAKKYDFIVDRPFKISCVCENNIIVVEFHLMGAFCTLDLSPSLNYHEENLLNIFTKLILLKKKHKYSILLLIRKGKEAVIWRPANLVSEFGEYCRVLSGTWKQMNMEQYMIGTQSILYHIYNIKAIVCRGKYNIYKITVYIPIED